MTGNEFSEMIGRVFLYLGANRPAPAQMDAWYEDVKRIPSEAVKAIEDRLKAREAISTKVNVPMIINQEFAKLAGTMLNPGLMVYDKIEDLRFPVGLMFRAYDILEQRGEVEFTQYCESVRMPQNERIRVRAKLTAVRAAESLVDRGKELAKTTSERVPF